MDESDDPGGISGGARWAIALVAVVALIVAFFVLRGTGDDEGSGSARQTGTSTSQSSETRSTEDSGTTSSDEDTTSSDEDTTSSDEDTTSSEQDTTSSEQDTTSSEQDTTSSEQGTTSSELETTTSGEDDSGPSGSTQSASTPVIRVQDGKPVGGVEKLSFERGEHVRFAVVSDAADEVHVHGYDLEKPVEPGKRVAFSFPGTIEGRFEIELHESGALIGRLDVTPS